MNSFGANNQLCRIGGRTGVWAAAALLAVLAGGAAAQPGPDYWLHVDSSSPETLAASIHAVIRDHTRIAYGTGNWPILEAADAYAPEPGTVLDFYKNSVIPIPVDSDRPYDREHIWSQSRGFPDGGAYSFHARSDLHNLFIADRNYNISRSNNYYATCPAPGCEERSTDLRDGEGGGSGVYPGNSNWRGSLTWEVWRGRRGDAARAVMYMATRYDGGAHADGNLEPDLRLTNDTTLLATGEAAVAYFAVLDDLMAWHAQDPPDAREIARHEVVAAAQHNRNPFIDYPEWGPCVYSGDCAAVAPQRPFGLVATNDGTAILLDWQPRPETNLTGYHVYRSTIQGGPYTRLTTTATPSPAYADGAVSGNTAYYYVVTALNTFGNESPLSDEVTRTLGDKVLIAQESFETAEGYTIVGGTGDFGASFFGRFTAATRPAAMRASTTGTDGQYYIALADADGGSPPMSADAIHTIILNPIDIRGFANLEVHLSVNGKAANEYDTAARFNGDYLRVLVQIDTTAETMIGQFTKVGTSGSNGRLGIDLDLDGLGDVEIQDYTRLEDYVFQVPPTLGNQGQGEVLSLSVRTRADAANEEIVYDNVRIYGTPLSTPPATMDGYVVY